MGTGQRQVSLGLLSSLEKQQPWLHACWKCSCWVRYIWTTKMTCTKPFHEYVRSVPNIAPSCCLPPCSRHSCGATPLHAAILPYSMGETWLLSANSCRERWSLLVWMISQDLESNSKPKQVLRGLLHLYVLFCGWWHTRTGCLEKWWSLPHWSYSGTI